MTQQEIFDTVCKHLAQQKEQAIGTSELGTSCRYRGKNNKKCAVGCLIPDEVYTPEMDNGWGLGKVLETSKLKHFRQYEWLLLNLQSAHDNAKDAEDLQRRLNEIADNNHLNNKSVTLIKEWKNLILQTKPS